MFGLNKLKYLGFLCALCLLFALFALPVGADRIGLLMSEVDGTPGDVYIYKIIMPNGTISITGGVATYTAGAGGGDLLADGTVPLTSNWDVGAFQIRALTFYSDQATGTAPFTVASTTVVANLNASFLEGHAASYFQIALAATHDTAAELDALYEAELDNSAGLLAALSDETGTGVAVFSTSPTLVTPILGTITSGNGTALTGVLHNVVEDPTPQLGGDLDLNGHSITGVGILGGTGLKSSTPVSGSTTGFAAGFTGANLYGGTYVVTSDDGDLQLPAMLAGMNFTIIVSGAIECVAATNVNDGYMLDGVDTAEDNSVVSTSTSGDIAVFQYYTADDWLITTNGWTTE